MKTDNIDELKCKLSAAILNYQREAEIYDWLALTAPGYTQKQFNKRYETWINKQSIERFGSETIGNWGLHGESKQHPAVNFSLAKSSYSSDYELRFSYTGQTAGIDYDNHRYVLRKSTEWETLYTVTSVKDITERAAALATSRRAYILQLQDNLQNISALMIEHGQLRADIKAFNDKLTFAISDDLRIRS